MGAIDTGGVHLAQQMLVAERLRQMDIIDGAAGAPRPFSCRGRPYMDL